MIRIMVTLARYLHQPVPKATGTVVKMDA